MSRYHGFATMYMKMPMSSSSLPIQGQCIVDSKRVTLKFPFTGIEFDLPAVPGRGDSTDFDFIIRSQKGKDMTVTICELPELKAFAGFGREEGEESAVLTFVFFDPETSPLEKLPKM